MSTTLIPDHSTSSVNVHICIRNQSAVGTKVFTACKMSQLLIADIAACFSEDDTRFPTTICELIQVKNIEMPDGYFVIGLYRIYSTVCSTALPQLRNNFLI